MRFGERPRRDLAVGRRNSNEQGCNCEQKNPQREEIPAFGGYTSGSRFEEGHRILHLHVSRLQLRAWSIEITTLLREIRATSRGCVYCEKEALGPTSGRAGGASIQH